MVFYFVEIQRSDIDFIQFFWLEHLELLQVFNVSTVTSIQMDYILFPFVPEKGSLISKNTSIWCEIFT